MLFPLAERMTGCAKDADEGLATVDRFGKSSVKNARLPCQEGPGKVRYNYDDGGGDG
jgi:hypothetical protein